MTPRKSKKRSHANHFWLDKGRTCSFAGGNFGAVFERRQRGGIS
jgi:hypothetical protein